MVTLNESVSETAGLAGLDEKISRFTEAAQSTVGRMNDLLSRLEPGIPPTEDDERFLSISFKELRELYTEIYAGVKAAQGDASALEPGCSVKELKTALSEIRLQQTRTAVLGVLNDFLQVTSHQSTFIELLKPHQKAARELIDALSREDLGQEDAAALIEKAKAPDMFMRALAMDPLRPEGKKFITEDLAPFYSAEIRIGFFTDAYAHPARGKILATLAEAAQAKETLRRNAADRASEEEARPVAPKAPEEPPILVHPVNKIRVGASASAFKNGLRDLTRSYDDMPNLLLVMGAIGAANADAISAIARYMDFADEDAFDDIDRAIMLLERKGWLARFDRDGKTLYGLSDFAASSLRKDSVITLLRQITGLQLGPGLMIGTGPGYLHNEDWRKLEETNEDASMLQFCLEQMPDTGDVDMYFPGPMRWVGNRNGERGLEIAILPPDFREVPCQIIHRKTRPERMCSQNALYIPHFVDGTDEDTPSPELCDAVRGALYIYRDGDFHLFKNTSAQNALPLSGKHAKTKTTAAVEKVPAESVPAIPAVKTAAEEPADTGTQAKASAAAKKAKAAAEKKPEPKKEKEQPKAKPDAQRKPAPADETPKRSPAEKPAAPAAATAPRKAPAKKAPAADLPALDRLIRAVSESETPDDALFCDAVKDLLESGKKAANAKAGASGENSESSGAAEAVLLSKSAGMLPGHEKSEELSRQIQLATGLILDNDITYTSMDLASIFPDPSSADAALLYSAYALALTTPDAPNDYSLRAQARELFSRYEEVFPKMPEFKGLFRTLLDLWDKTASGFSPSVMMLLGDTSESEAYIEELRRQAKDNLRVVPPTTQLKPLVPMYNAAFGPGSDLYQCMDIISRDVRHKRIAVERVLQNYCDPAIPDQFHLSAERIEDALNERWEKASTKNFRLEYVARDKAIRHYKDRLQIMISWVNHLRTLENKPAEMSVLKKYRDKLKRDLGTLERKQTWKSSPHAGLLQWTITRMADHLNNAKKSPGAFSEVLKTGWFWLDEDEKPVFDPELAKVRFYEPWRRAVQHIKAMRENPDRTFEDVCAEILDEVPGGPEGLMDNLYQLETIGRVLGKAAPSFEITDDLRTATEEAARDSRRELEERLDIAYALGQVNAADKQRIEKTMDTFSERFFEKRDFASWRRFLRALSMQISDSAETRIQSALERIAATRKERGDLPLLSRAEAALMEDRNYTIAEEYLNRVASGDTQWAPAEAGGVAGTGGFFADFRNPDVFQPLLDECRRNGEGGASSSLKVFGPKYVRAHRPADWTARHAAKSEEFLQAWPGGKGTSPAQICTVVNSLGLDAQSAVLTRQRGNMEVFQVKTNPVPRGKKSYAHPIAAFGTRLESPLNVVVIYGKCIEDQLVETMRELDFDDISLVLLDYHMDPGQRRQLAEIVHRQTKSQNRYLVVDRVLALYLAFRKDTERLKAMLQCTLPYTAVQPFGMDGGATPDEMFCGRETELESIMSPSGACIVYGGRQLGKTALLQRAQSRSHVPDRQRYAVYSNILRCDSEEALAKKLTDDITAACGSGVPLEPSKNLDELTRKLGALLNNGTIKSMLLLMDEADPFLRSIEDSGYSALQPLVELMQAHQNKFKFVIAGLHNVCRAERAMANNGVFGQLGTPLCIRPFSSAEASRLLSRPLRYLGFEIPDKQLETLVTNSNFYPGVLQFIGRMLVEALPEHYQKAYYSAAGNPPFGLDDGYLGAVLKSRDLNASIQSKVRGTLELDPRYFMIARIIALLQYMDDDRAAEGYSASEIRSTALEYEVECLADESLSSLTTLLEEMMDMGILVSTNGKTFRFRRDSFCDVIGTDADELEAALHEKAAVV